MSQTNRIIQIVPCKTTLIYVASTWNGFLFQKLEKVGRKLFSRERDLELPPVDNESDNNALE